VGAEYSHAPLSGEEIRRILQMLSSGDDESAVHVTERSETFNSGFVQGGIPTTDFEVGAIQGGKLGWLQQTVTSTDRGLFASMDSISENASGAFTGSKTQFTDAFFTTSVTEAVIANVEKAIKNNNSSGAVLTSTSGEGVNVDYYITEIRKILDEGTDITPELVEALIAQLTTCYSCDFSLMAENWDIGLCGGETCLVVDRNLEVLPAVYAALSQTPTSGSDPVDMEKFTKNVSNMIDDIDRTWQEQQGKANQSGSNSAGQGGGSDIFENIIGMLQQMGGGSGLSDSLPYTNEATAMRQANTNIETKGDEALKSIETLLNEPNQCTTTRTGYTCTKLQCPIHSGVAEAPVAAKPASETETDRYGKIYNKTYLGVNFPALCSSGRTDSGKISISTPRLIDATRDTDYFCLPYGDQELIWERIWVKGYGGEATKEWWFGLGNASSDPAYFEKTNHDWCNDGKCSRLANDLADINKHCMLWHLLECKCACVEWGDGSAEPKHREQGISTLGDDPWTSSVNGQKVEPKRNTLFGLFAEGCNKEDAEKHLSAALKCYELSKGTPQTCCRHVPRAKDVPNPIGITVEKTAVHAEQGTAGTVVTASTSGGEKIRSETGVFRRVGRHNVRRTCFIQRPTTGSTVRKWGRGLRRLGDETAINGPRFTADGGILDMIELRAFGSPAGFTLGDDMFASGRHGMHNPLETEIMLYDMGWEPGMPIKLLADSTGWGDNSYARRLSQFLTYTNFEVDSLGNYVLDQYDRRKPIPTTVIAPTGVVRDRGSGEYVVLNGKWLEFTAGNPGIPLT